jgi:lysophospholipase L1-like esterase
MTIHLQDGATVMFTGDSITDAFRILTEEDGLGFGYPRFVAAGHGIRRPGSGIRWLNSGVGGNRVVDLEQRWPDEVLATKPDLLSVLVGVNDTWRRYDSNDETTAEQFGAGYRRLLESATASGISQILLIEPFLLPIGEQRGWRADLDPKIQLVRALAEEFGAHLLAADGMFAQLSATTGPAFWAEDGVHPTPAGHQALANAWLDLVS